MNGIQSCDWRSQAIVHSPQFEHIQEERLREQNQRILNNLQFRARSPLWEYGVGPVGGRGLRHAIRWFGKLHGFGCASFVGAGSSSIPTTLSLL